MRKAINFDINTKKYEEITNKPAPTAYSQIKSFLKKNGFEHRQGSGYISKDSLDDLVIVALITNMTLKYKWLKDCVKQIDVTNIGRQHSLVDAVQNAPTENDLSNMDDIEL